VLALALNNRRDDLIEHLGDSARARPMLEESLSLRRALGEKRGVALTLLNLGALTLREGHAEQAVPLYDESLTLAREVGLVPHTAWALAGLGLAAVYQGPGERAVPLLQESLQLARDLRDRYTIAECLSGLASVAADRTELPGQLGCGAPPSDCTSCSGPAHRRPDPSITTGSPPCESSSGRKLSNAR
jgi:tetratricopeptide (TPR) repeat protein